MDDATFWIAILGAVTGIIGTITGIIGTALSVLQYRRQIDAESVNLNVSVGYAMNSSNPDDELFRISVRNKSAFRVIIQEAGIYCNEKKMRAIHPHAMTNRGPLPQAMEPRSELSILFPPEYLAAPLLKTASVAYVSTQCGTTVEAGAEEIPRMVAAAQSDE
jgi:hypothetical protein